MPDDTAVITNDTAPETPDAAPEAVVAPRPLSAGDRLAARRRELGLSVRDLSETSNIPEDRLSAIEDSDIMALPNAPFTLGFVRTIATLLDLPADEVVEDFRKDAGYPEPTAVPRIAPRPRAGLGSPAQISLVTVLGLVMFCVWIAWQVVEAAAPDVVAEVEGTPLSNQSAAEVIAPYQSESSLTDDVPLITQANLGLSSLRRGGTLLAEQPVVSEPSEAAAATESSPIEIVRAGAESEGQRPSPLDDVVAASDSAAVETALPDGAEPVDAEVASVADQLNAQSLEALIEVVVPRDETAEPVSSAPEILAESTAPDATQDTTQVTPEAAPSAPIDVVDDGIEIVRTDLSDEPTLLVSTQPIVRLEVGAIYPARCESSAAAEESITVSFTVSRFGKVTDPAIADSTNSCFNRAALAAVSRWDFEPATNGERPITSDPQSTVVTFRRP